MNIKKNNTIGVWGYGIVGKAAVNYFLKEGYAVSIMDKRKLSSNESMYCKNNNIIFYTEEEKNNFFDNNDIIISSPGIVITQEYSLYKDKWLHELDIFYHLFAKPIIAITGSVGKTSCTHILAALLTAAKLKIVVGGNIGIATFDLLQQTTVDYAVLETSSFQLEQCHYFSPHLAIITNIYPNHLDHHETEENYLAAKCKILEFQKENSFSLIPWHLKEMVPPAHHLHQRSYFSNNELSDEQLQECNESESVYYRKNHTIYQYHRGVVKEIFSDENLNFSFSENILILAAACDILKINMDVFHRVAKTIQLPQHRLEYITTHNGISFYNDSKATTTASTLAAIEQLSHKSLHLFVGGLSKGVDRSSFIAQLQNKVKYVYCFGSEANILYNFCLQYAIPAQPFLDLEEAVTTCFDRINNGDCVLFSPAGSSYDLYENYEKRGEHFKQLMMKLKKDNLIGDPNEE